MIASANSPDTVLFECAGNRIQAEPPTRKTECFLEIILAQLHVAFPGYSGLDGQLAGPAKYFYVFDFLGQWIETSHDLHRLKAHIDEIIESAQITVREGVEKIVEKRFRIGFRPIPIL
jgi:hypothetical protein